MIKLSDYIAKYLKEFYNVDRVFLVSGGGAMFLNDSFGRYIPYTACHHEQACAFAAEGYARANDKLAVVNVTTGPGGLNCLNGLFGQWTDSVPVLYISGQVKTTTMMESYGDNSLRQLGDQEVDIISVVKSLTKYCVTVTDPLSIKYHIDKAIHLAISGRKGPVWLNIPIDIQSSLIDESKFEKYVPEVTEPVDYDCSLIIDKLLNAKRPLIVCGHGVRLSGQIEELKDFLIKTKIPVVTTLNGFDILPTDYPNYVGRIGTIGQRAANFALQNADLVLFLGTRNNIRQVSYNWGKFAENAYKIVVDIDLAELNKPLVKPDLKVCCDLKYVISQLFNKLKYVTDESWVVFCQNLKNKYSFENNPEQQQDNYVIDPYHFTYCLSQQLKAKSLLVMANGSATVCTFQNAVVKDNQRFITNSGNASMGYALPAAIGASFNSKFENIVCLEGDGSLMMNIQELQTIIHYNLPIKLFVINNNGYSSIQQTQTRFFNRLTGAGSSSGVSFPNFIEIAKAFGLPVKLIDNPSTMSDNIVDVLNTVGPVFCEVKTKDNYEFLPKLSSKTLEDGTIISPSLEDMYPFLDRDEYSANMIVLN